MMRKTIMITLIMLSLGCKNNKKQVTLFFNPVRALHLTEIKFKIELNTRVILDTIVINNSVDKSLFMKRFNINTTTNNVLLIRINNKSIQVNDLDIIKNCSNIFTFYDNFTSILDKASQIEKEKINMGLTSDYKLIVDSLRKSIKNDYYDKIEVIVKPGKCNN